MLKTRIGDQPWAIISRYVSGVAVVSDDDVIEALRYAVSTLKLVIEPTSAVALAALLTGQIADVSGKRILVIVSGGNIGADAHAALIA